MHSTLRLAAIFGLAVLVAGCSVSTGSRFGSFAAPAPEPAATPPSEIPAPNGEPIQYFAVPAQGRAALLARLDVLAGGPGTYGDVRISNAWRTAASAQVTPNDYAACVSARTARGVQTWMVVVSGGGTGDAIGGADGVRRCGDPSRVQQWEALG